MIWDFLKSLWSLLGWAHKRDETRRKFRLDDEIEDRLVELLSDPRYKRRTFKIVREKIGGFDETPDELRRHLVRIGAERSGTPGDGELWGLRLERHESLKKRRVSSRRLWVALSLVLVAALVGVVQTQKLFGPICPNTCDPENMSWEEYKECQKCNGLSD